uniref:Uncharacterized protein n=1 Tax=Sarcophilus harrisii TaxID=9305 RepID=A0A7N4NMH5_SARHA
MASSSVPDRYRRDASTEMIRTKVARRKSVTWKENRYKKFEQNRHFGLIDVNTTALEDRNLPPLDETIENFLEKETVKPSEYKLGFQRKKLCAYIIIRSILKVYVIQKHI